MDNGAQYKQKDKNKWTPISIAISYGDKEMVEIIYRYYLKRRKEKMHSRTLIIADYFKKMQNFYVEFNWKVKIPLFSFLCPNDIIKITKYGANTRADSTFYDYKRLSVIRKPISYYLKYNENSKGLDIFRVDRNTNEFCDYMEDLDDEEIELILKDLMNKQRMNGSFKLLECKLEENSSFFDKDKKIIEEIHGMKAQQYTLNLKVQLDNHPTAIINYIDLNEDNYLNENVNIIQNTQSFGEKELHKGIQDGLHIKNDVVIKGIKELEQEKKMTATVWIVHNSPINSEDAVHLLESIASANEFMDKVLEFFHHPDIKKIIDTNGFPIKVVIPYNFFIDLSFSFDKYMEIKEDNVLVQEIFKPLDNSVQRTRKDVQDLKTNYKIRAGYANIR